MVKRPKAKTALPRIFVQIASYRDPECQWTVKDLFEKAAHPERISVGICWQFIREQDAQCFQVPYPYPDQVRVHEVDAREGRGVCWARSLTQKLWQGEEFSFQIDSHIRFEPGWDETMLAMWKECGSDKAVLTCYPPGYTPPNELEKKFIFGMSAKEFDKDGIFLMVGAPAFEVGVNEPAKPIPGAFASANTLFGPSGMIKDVPYDPHLYFFGEEISMAVRLWTSGYDLFHPNRLVVYHDWNRGKRPTHFDDCRDWGRHNDRAFARVRHLLKTQVSSDPQVLAEIDRYGLGTVRSLEDYQRFSGVDFARRTIGDQARKGQFLAPLHIEEGKQPRIFVNIASYRDPECQWTVKDLFEKAAHPERIFVGICWQYDMAQDAHCFEVNTRPEQVRVFPVDWREAEGVCWARHQAQQLWEGEEYTLMIDSHMRFVPGWDEMMIGELAVCDSPKPVLSCSPVPYTPPNNLSPRMNPTVRRVKPFMPDGNIRCQGESLDRPPPKPLRGAFLVANFIFSRSEITPQVPYDPFLYFDQEEITYAARLYTHGWDIFSPRRQFLYHFYNDNKAPAGSVRPLHWRDLHRENESRIRFLRDRGLKRFNHMTGYSASYDPEVVRELDKYGFGTVRSFEQFEQFSGVDFKRKIATQRALQCEFIEDLRLYRDRPMGEAPPPVGGRLGGGAMTHNGPPPRPSPLQGEGVMLEPGDFFPFLEMDDTNRKVRAIETFGGKFCMVFYLPAGNPEFLTRFFAALPQVPDAWQIFILDAPAEELIALKQRLNIGAVLHADGQRAIARSFGIKRPPVGFVLNTKLQITHRHSGDDPQQLAAAVARDCAAAMESFRRRNQSPPVIREMAPALIVPGVFSPELCAKCIQAFRSGHTFDGTVGAMEAKAYRADVKLRTDYIVQGELLVELDEKLSRSFFPEIKKIFGVEITHRELYKIGMYSGEKKGFFKAHRDNFDAPLGYRHIAATIHLNDEYEGGGLRFPEYDDHIYRPAAGSGIGFSCSTLHEARPVTKGERFVLVGFFHGEEDEAYRRHYQLSKNLPLRVEDYTPVRRTYPEVRQSRGFFEEWKRENVRYDAGASSGGGVIRANSPVSPLPASALQGEGVSFGPRKVFESRQAVIFDDFLPEDVYNAVNAFALTSDYERINTSGKSVRAWHVHDGFPLRTSKNVFYYAQQMEHPNRAEHAYPSNTPIDKFIEQVLVAQPQVEHIIGAQTRDWEHFSVTGWMYPHGTGLSMHDDGSGVYAGAYVYFLNPTWRPHWGGLLLLADEEANRRVHEYRAKVDQMDYYQRKWLHANPLDEMLVEQGFAQCVFPKRNRMVFIANDAYHMVTRVNEQSGDNLRMSLAGFFNRRKK